MRKHCVDGTAIIGVVGPRLSEHASEGIATFVLDFRIANPKRHGASATQRVVLPWLGITLGVNLTRPRWHDLREA